jgi:hypothetical protein
MKRAVQKALTRTLVAMGLVLVVTRLPQLVSAALLRGTGTVVREQKAWVPVTPEEKP